MSDVPPVDRFTVGHAMVGFLLGMWGVPWWLGIGTGVAWEVIENPIKRAAPGLFPDGRPDTIANAAIDAGAWAGGFLLARALFADYPVSKLWRSS